MEYKPLSELAKDEEACRKIAERLRIYKHKVEVAGNYFTISGRDSDHAFSNQTWIRMGYDGQINGLKMISVSIFTLVDFIRSLGYSA